MADYEDKFRNIIDHSLLFSKFAKIAQEAFQEGVKDSIRQSSPAVEEAFRQGIRAAIEAAEKSKEERFPGDRFELKAMRGAIGYAIKDIESLLD